MQWYEAEVRALEQKFKASPPPPNCAAFYGSSSVRMWNDLAQDLGDDRAVNVGFGGSTLAACVYFFDRLVPPLHPASLVLYAGDNDLGDGCSPEDVCQSFCNLLGRIRRTLTAVAFSFISIKLSPARYVLRDSILRTNQLIRHEMERTRTGTYIDVSKAMLDELGKPRPEFFTADGLHLSRAGYRLWAQQLQPFRNQIFTPLSSHNGTKSATLEP